MARLDREFEARHVRDLINSGNEVERILNKAADDIAMEIRRLQPKANVESTTFIRRITRSKRIQAAIKRRLEEMRVEAVTYVEDKVRRNWELANTKNDDLVKGYLRNVVISNTLSNSYFQPNFDALNTFLESEAQISSRVLNYVNVSEQVLVETLGSGITQGKPSRTIARTIRKALKNPTTKINPGRGVYNSLQKNLERITRTETNRAYRTSDNMRYQQLDFVVGYRVNLSNAHADQDICDFMQGDYPKNFFFSEWHPHCLCYVTSILMRKDEFRNFLKTGNVISKNRVIRMPRRAERYVLSRGDKWRGATWKRNFTSDNRPIALLGGQSKGIESYKINLDDAYDASPDRYLQRARNVQ